MVLLTYALTWLLGMTALESPVAVLSNKNEHTEDDELKQAASGR